jgi:hypothetical protein
MVSCAQPAPESLAGRFEAFSMGIGVRPLSVTVRVMHVVRGAQEAVVRHRGRLAAAGVILCAALVRLALISAGWPGTDSDEATMGLMAIHILRDGEHPIFFYGQAYMGSIEAHLAAVVFAVLGVSVFSLKVALILLYVCFMVVMWLLLRQLFTPRRALFGLALLIFGGGDLLGLELHAFGGYLETLCFGTLVILLSAWLIRIGGDPTRRRGARAAGLAAWGLAAGLGIYSDPLVLPFVIVSAAGLALGCWSHLRSRLGALALAGLLLGLAPWTVYAITAPSADAAKSFLQRPVHRQAATAQAPQPALGEMVVEHLVGTVVVAVPDMIGGEALFPVGSDTWPPTTWTTPARRLGALLRGLYGLGFIACLIVALGQQAKLLWAIRRKPSSVWSALERAQAARTLACLIALAAPSATIIAFAVSDASSAAPWIFSRYLIGLLIALPVVVCSLFGPSPTLMMLPSPAALRARAQAPLGSLGSLVDLRRSLARYLRVRSAQPPAGRFAALWRFSAVEPARAPLSMSWRGVWRIGQFAGMLLLVALLVLSTLDIISQIPALREQNRVRHDLVERLLRRGDTQIDSEFWTCYWVIFASDERILCAALNTDMTRRASRYPPYDAAMGSASPKSFAFPLPSAQADAFPAWAAAQGWRFTSATVDAQYVIFTVEP